MQHVFCAAVHKSLSSGVNVMEFTTVAEQPKTATEPVFTLEGRTALVTGAGRGIGKAIARRLAAAGACVMINDLDEAMLHESETEFAAPDRVQHVCGDLTDPTVPESIVQATLSAFGAIDIIVNNAGYSWDNVIQKTTDEQFLAMLEIHLVTPFRLLRAASTFIRESAKREIAAGQRVMRKVVNITSIAGTDGNPGQIGYSSGKAGVIGLTKTLAKEWGRYNVNVNAVGFGLIQTRLVQDLNAPGAGMEMHGHHIRLGVQPSLLDSVKTACPLGRLGTPEEAAGAVLFFCSPLSDYVTGEVLICGGGLHF
jgi:3-oxoacyl-[acyl-carrier protein] reductase